MIKRWITADLKRAMRNQSAIALLGPRQTGKTTLAHLIAKKRSVIYLDLESPEDLLKLDNPLLFLSQHLDLFLMQSSVKILITSRPESRSELKTKLGTKL